MKKRLLALILAVIMVTSMLPANASAYSTGYPNTWTNTGNQAYDIAQIALTQVGYVETVKNHTKYNAWFYGYDKEDPWCAIFISWCANQAGIPTSTIKKQASALKGKFGTPTYGYSSSIQVGDIAYIGKAGGSNSSHVGIVVDVSGSTIKTVEGNNSDKVKMGTFSLSNGKRNGSQEAILFYGRPNYGGSGSTPPSVPVGTTSKPNVSVSGRTVNVSWSYSGSGTSFDVYVIQSPWDWSGIKYKQNVTGNSCTFWDVDPGYCNVFTVAQPNNRQVQSEWAELIVQEPHTNHSNGGFRYTASEHPHYNYYSCSVCGQEFTDGSTERNNNCSQCHWEHAWDEWSVTKPPKVGVDGEKVYTCTICGEKKTEKIPQLPKKWGSLEGDGVTYVVGIPDEGFTVTVKANGTLYFNGQGEPSTGGLLSYSTEDLWPFIESNVTTVIIGEGVTSLRITSLFHRLKNLSKIVLPDSIETISFSLHENPLVKELYIPKNTKNLWLANGAAQNLKAINVDPQNMTYTSIDGVVYSKDMSEIIRCPGGKEGDLVIPDGVTKIDEKAFAYSDKITSVTVPDSVVEFGKTWPLPNYMISISKTMPKPLLATPLKCSLGLAL